MALSEWNKFVSKVYKEGKSSSPDYQFKDALKDASKRKGEMGIAAGVTKTKKVRKASKSKKSKKSNKGSRKSRKH